MLRYLLVCLFFVAAFGGKDFHVPFDPPDTLAECIEELEDGLDDEISFEEVHLEAKNSCVGKCVPAEVKECVDMESIIAGFKKEFKPVKDALKQTALKAHKCMTRLADEDKGKSSDERRCSHQPMNYPEKCFKKIIHHMMKSDEVACIGKCMFEKLGKGKGMPEVDEEFLEEIKGKLGKEGKGKGPPEFLMRAFGKFGKGGGKGGKGGKFGKFGKGKGKGKGNHCYVAFCTEMALLGCAEESGLEDAMEKTGEVLLKLQQKFVEEFPKHCKCFRKYAESQGLELPDELKDANCDDLPNVGVCRAFGKLGKGPHGFEPPMSRKRRSVNSLYGEVYEHLS